MTLKAVLNTASSDVIAFPSFYGTDQLLVPFVQSAANDQVHIFILKRSDLTRVTNMFFTFPFTTDIRSVSVNTDSS